jgi:hypothetical protein
VGYTLSGLARGNGKISDSEHLAWLLLSGGGERHKSEADCKNDREPDPPHGHLL